MSLRATYYILTLLIVTFATTEFAKAGTLEDVQKRGYLKCGINTGLAGFASPDDKGNWKGLDIDLCIGVTAAIFGDPSKVKYSPLNAKERFTALQSGEVDLLARNTTWNFSRDTDLKLDFVGVNYYDGQGFMVRKSLKVKSAKELNGASVCVQTGTTTELNLTEYFRANNMKLDAKVFEKNEEARQAYDSGRCDAYTTDASGLAAERSVLAKPDDHIILPEIISKEPLGPAVRHGDNNWGDVVRWVLNAMIIAEEMGITSQNVDTMKTSANPEIKRFLGAQDELGKMIGLSNDWAYKVVKYVGNYGESFERNVGAQTPLKLERGLNQLWNKGGILYAPPYK
ncbi:MAG: amino acid ABC transporter substrate-binding protein [Alphaproteobacteria bacterium]|nr:amino acid ABC transporter substrate-binding protein [Alphaproteobacteria bacterium]